MKRAFTLIELLVVIAIIAILAAILFPVFAQAKLAAKKTAGLSEVKQMGTATLIYMNDGDDHTVPNWYYPTGDGSYTTYMDMLYPYLKNTAVAINPGQSTNVTDYGVAAATGKTITSHYIIPSFNPFTYYSWAGTVMFAGWPVEANAITTATGGVCSNLSAYAFCIGPGQVAQPADAVSLVPGYLAAYKLGAGYAGANLQFGSANTLGFPSDPTTQAGKQVFIYNVGANYGFCDGHAKFFASNKMNKDNSSTYNYGGTAYPASPYMKVAN